MTTILKAEGVQIWQTALASNVRSGLYTEAFVEPYKGLHVVRGRYQDGTSGGVVAKYSIKSRADDAAAVVNRLALLDPREN